MSFRTRRILFSSPILAIIEFIVLKYILSLFNVSNDLLLALFVLIMMFLEVVPMLFEQKNSTRIGRLLSQVFSIWEWLFVMLIIYTVIIFLISLLISIPVNVLFILYLTLVVIAVYAYVNAHRLVVKERVLEFDDIINEYNIIHLSDVHFGSIRHKQIIKDIADKIKEIESDCDVVIISGDLADGSSNIEVDDFNEFKKISIPIIFTSGNHDYYPGISSVHEACRNAGMIILENEAYELNDLNIYGLSYSFDDIDMPSREELVGCIEKDKINIVNYHIPNGWNELCDIGFDIQLSGHTHGGQFYPAVFFGNLMYEGHNMGLFNKKIDNKEHYLHVTTGVGSMDMPFRWGTNSEIVILKIRRKT